MAHTLTELVMGMIPIVVEETRGFWEGTLVEELRIQRCDSCGNVQLPASACCTACLSQDLAWVKASGRAEVFSFTIVRHPFHPSFADKIPYIVADVQLEEGPVITSNVTGCEVEDVRIGMPLEVWFDEQVEDAFHSPLRLPRFRPRQER